MNQAVLSAYGNLRSVYNNPFIRLGEIRSDNTLALPKVEMSHIGG